MAINLANDLAVVIFCGGRIRLCESTMARTIWRIALKILSWRAIWNVFKEELDFGGAQVPKLKSRRSFSPYVDLRDILNGQSIIPRLLRC